METKPCQTARPCDNFDSGAYAENDNPDEQESSDYSAESTKNNRNALPVSQYFDQPMPDPEMPLGNSQLDTKGYDADVNHNLTQGRPADVVSERDALLEALTHSKPFAHLLTESTASDPDSIVLIKSGRELPGERDTLNASQAQFQINSKPDSYSLPRMSTSGGRSSRELLQTKSIGSYRDPIVSSEHPARSNSSGTLIESQENSNYDYQEQQEENSNVAEYHTAPPPPPARIFAKHYSQVECAPHESYTTHFPSESDESSLSYQEEKPPAEQQNSYFSPIIPQGDENEQGDAQPLGSSSLRVGPRVYLTELGGSQRSAANSPHYSQDAHLLQSFSRTQLSSSREKALGRSQILNNNNNNNQHSINSPEKSFSFLTKTASSESVKRQTTLGPPRHSVASFFSESMSSEFQLSGLTSSVRDWNAEFQEIVEKPASREKYQALRNLGIDFVQTAELYGKIIIEERSFPIDEKTIKPATVGGIAGGEKFIIGGILFKFAFDKFNLYGSTENAMKAANHDLKGLLSYHDLHLKPLHFPLLALLTYRGFRLICLSLLPISSRSLVYGSVDGGKTVISKDNKIAQLMDLAGRLLGLKKHGVGISGSGEIMMHNCCDLEGHVGSDGRFYLLDFARVAPPAPITAPNSHLFNLFRMEFVRAFEKPLSPDGFSKMGLHKQKEHNQDLRDAYVYLHQTVIPTFAKSINKAEILKYDTFISELHGSGVNLRFIGQVRQHMEDPALMKLLLRFAVIRVSKSLLRELMRDISSKNTTHTSAPYSRAISEFLNTLCGYMLKSYILNNFKQNKGERSYQFSENILKPRLEAKYPGILQEREKIEPLRFESLIASPAEFQEFILALGDSVGIRWKFGTISSLRSTPQKEFRFIEADIQETKVQISHMNIIDSAEGMVMFYEAKDNPHIPRLAQLAELNLKTSLRAITNYEIALKVAKVTLFRYRSSEGSADQLKEAQIWLESVAKSDHPLKRKALMIMYKYLNVDKDNLLESAALTPLDVAYLKSLDELNRPVAQIEDFVRAESALQRVISLAQQGDQSEFAQEIHTKCAFSLLFYYRSVLFAPSEFGQQSYLILSRLEQYRQLVILTSKANPNRFVRQLHRLPSVENWLVALDVSIVPTPSVLTVLPLFQRLITMRQQQSSEFRMSQLGELLYKNIGSSILQQFMRLFPRAEILFASGIPAWDLNAVLAGMQDIKELVFEEPLSAELVEEVFFQCEDLRVIRAPFSAAALIHLLAVPTVWRLAVLCIAGYQHHWPQEHWGNLRSLQAFSAANSSFSDLHLLEETPCLTHLNLQRSKVSQVPDNFKHSTVQWLNLQDTPLEQHSQIVPHFPNLISYYFVLLSPEKHKNWEQDNLSPIILDPKKTSLESKFWMPNNVNLEVGTIAEFSVTASGAQPYFKSNCEWLKNTSFHVTKSLLQVRMTAQFLDASPLKVLSTTFPTLVFFDGCWQKGKFVRQFGATKISTQVPIQLVQDPRPNPKIAMANVTTTRPLVWQCYPRNDAKGRFAALRDGEGVLIDIFRPAASPEATSTHLARVEAIEGIVSRPLSLGDLLECLFFGIGLMSL